MMAGIPDLWGADDSGDDSTAVNFPAHPIPIAGGGLCPAI
jgi:hypothetical protein